MQETYTLGFSTFIFYGSISGSMMISLSLSGRVVNKSGLPTRKKMEGFEILAVNLLPNTPFNYGYSLGQNNRVIQVANRAALAGHIKTNFRSVYYLKTKESEDFVLFGSTKEHRKEIYANQIAMLSAKVDQNKKSGWLFLMISGILFYFTARDSISIYAFALHAVLVLVFFLVLPYSFMRFLRNRLRRRLSNID